MGSCFGKCISFKNRLWKCKKSHFGARFTESSSIIEFESLIGEDDSSIYPQSYVLPHEKAYLHAGHLDFLVAEQKIRDKSVFLEFRRREEALELEEEHFNRGDMQNSETGSLEVIDIKEVTNINYEYSNGDNHGSFEIDRDEDFDEFLSRIHAKTLASSSNDQPLILCATSLLKNDGSTTHSSVELDWESEGLPYPPLAAYNTDEDVATTRTETVSLRSHHDSNSSTSGFEWDEDVFSLPDNRQRVDTETEQLLDEIERFTNRALNETGPNR
ncbi:Uncharacterised protein g3710 [Pycnogonum litorale]